MSTRDAYLLSILKRAGSSWFRNTTKDEGNWMFPHWQNNKAYTVPLIRGCNPVVYPFNIPYANFVRMATTGPKTTATETDPLVSMLVSM